MRPGRQDLNVIFLKFRSCRQLAPCRPLRGRQAPIFENFPIRHIFLKFCFFKYKNEKSAAAGHARLQANEELCAARSPAAGQSKEIKARFAFSIILAIYFPIT